MQTLYGKIIFWVGIIGAIFVIVFWRMVFGEKAPLWVIITMLLYSVYVAIYQIIQKHRDDKSR